MLTFNRLHFVRLHTRRPQHAGIIVVSFDADFVALATRIDRSIRAAGLLEGRLLRIDRPA